MGIIFDMEMDRTVTTIFRINNFVIKKMITGPKFWGILYPTCRGQNQSPIDINLLNVQEVKIEKLKWENYSELPTSMTEINNGHTSKAIYFYFLFIHICLF